MKRAQRRPRDYGAFVEPRGVAIVEFRRIDGGLEILSHAEVAEHFAGIEEAAQRLGELVAAEARPGASVAVAVRGFGVTSELLTLPPAKRPVLQRVVARELARMHPDIHDPVTDFASGGRLERRQAARAEPGVPQQEVLAAVAPRAVIDTLTDALSSHALALQHVTVGARCIVKLFDELSADDEPSALVLAAATGPLIGFFHEGALRFVVEPPAAGIDDPETNAAIIADQIRRGNMYLRQQFRGTEVQRVLVGADNGKGDQLGSRLAETLRLDVSPLAPTLGGPLTLLALGAVLDAREEGGVNLYPREAELAEERRRGHRRMAVVFATVLAVLVGAWAVAELVGGARAANGLGSLRREAAAAVELTRPMASVVAERQANAQRIDALVDLARARAVAPRILRVLDALTADGITVTALSLTNADGSWAVTLAGHVFAMSNAAAVRRVDLLYRELPRALTIGNLTISELEYAAEEGPGARFAMTLSDVTVDGEE